MPLITPALKDALISQSIVYVFGAGITSSLTGRNYGWWNWIIDGIQHMKDTDAAEGLERSIKADDSAENLIKVVGDVIIHTKEDGTYDDWMQGAFESAEIINDEIVHALNILNLPQDIFVTTNYDSYLEEATRTGILTRADSGKIFEMIDSGSCSSVVHIHGAYSSKKHIDNIVASQEQYDELYNDEGAQFIQNLLGTRSLIFIGCGKTTDDKNIAHFIRFACEHLNLDVPYFYLKKEGDEAPELPDHFHIIDYGKDYCNLPGFLEEIALFRNRMLTDKMPIIGRTIRTDSESLGEYHYANEKLGFVGRKAELNFLGAFLKDSRRILWQAITGQGGSGKSRLAYEFLKENDHEWFGFFWNDAATLSDIESFKPFCNTIVVIDYIKGREKNVAEWMHALFGKFSLTDFKLRLLLLERESDKGAGSWFSELENEWGKFDRALFSKAAFSTEFLNLADLDDDSVSSLIGEVREANGLPHDKWQDNRLREDYHGKFEKLRYRPLFVQLYVEAWIANKCTEPDYSSFEGVIESALLREQDRWLDFFDDNKAIVRSFIRLLVRAAAGGELSDANIPKIYKDDWENLKGYFKSLSLPGKQKKESYRNFLSDLTQNFEQDSFTLKTYYPDIINEYMFSYYAEDDLDDVVNELKEDAGQHFSLFLQRAQMDFPDNEVFSKVVSKGSEEDTTPDMLFARLAKLRGRHIVKAGETLESRKAVVDEEYRFWHSVQYIENAGQEQTKEASTALLKMTGLYYCSEHYGALVLLDDMDKCINEMVSMKGELLDLMKLEFLEERMNACSRAGYTEYAKKYERTRRTILDKLKENDKDLTGFDHLTALQEANNDMMDYLMSDDVYRAKEVLNKAYKSTDFSDQYAVEDLARMVERYGLFQLQFGGVKYEEYVRNIAEACKKAYPDDGEILSSYYQAMGTLIQSRLIKLGHNPEKTEPVKEEALQLIRDVEANRSITSDAWGVVAFLPIGWMDREDEAMLLHIITEAERRLAEEHSVESAKAWINAQRRLFELRGEKIPKEIVDQAFAYYLRDPTSETTREYFFLMLDESTEKSHKSQYILPNVKDSMYQDAMFNPMYDLDAMGQLEDVMQEPEFRERYMQESSEDRINTFDVDYDDIFEPQKPYVRPGKKIGRNDPCPCGSGKKYKNCCGRKK